MAGYLTLEEAAERLGVEYKTVYRLVRSGELPAGKIGRIYRIREADLETFFEQQKQELAAEARAARPIALESTTCGACGQTLVSRLSVAGTCDVCGAPICQACQAIKKIHRCDEHAGSERAESSDSDPMPATGRNQPKQPARQSRFDDVAAQVQQLRQAGRVVVTSAEARTVEENFVRSFAQRLERLNDLPDPLSQQRITLAKARVKHELKSAGAASPDRPGNVASRFRLRSGGWGRPKAGLVLEARFVTRDEQLRDVGYDGDPLGEAELTPILSDLRQRAQKEGCYHVVVLGSPTGWDDTAIALVTHKARGRAFQDRHVGLALYDLHNDQAHLDRDDADLREFWPLLTPLQYANELARTVSAVAGLLGKMDGVALDFAARTLSLPLGWVRAAFEQLRQEKGYRTDELPDLGLVLLREKP